MVTQDGHLFHESVRENLLLAGPEATEDELWDALRRARLDELVASLPDGLDTVVGERGYRLSGGERQRLTIARLLLAHPRVVILDEATAHLDSTSEAAVQAALGEALAGRTAIVIAHRLSTIRAADLILVVEDGPGRRARPARSNCWPPAAATPSSTGPSSRTQERPDQRLTVASAEAHVAARADRCGVSLVQRAAGGPRTRCVPGWLLHRDGAVVGLDDRRRRWPGPRPVLAPWAAPAARTRLVSARVKRSKT